MSAGIIQEVARSSGAFLAPLTVQQYRAMMHAGILREARRSSSSMGCWSARIVVTQGVQV